MTHIQMSFGAKVSKRRKVGDAGAARSMQLSMELCVLCGPVMVFTDVTHFA